MHIHSNGIKSNYDGIIAIYDTSENSLLLLTDFGKGYFQNEPIDGTLGRLPHSFFSDTAQSLIPSGFSRVLYNSLRHSCLKCNRYKKARKSSKFYYSFRFCLYFFSLIEKLLYALLYSALDFSSSRFIEAVFATFCQHY